MRIKRVDPNTVERFNPTYNEGLNEEQVNKRKEQGLINKTNTQVGKTHWEIIRDNVLTFFNVMLFVIAGFMIYANVADGDPSTPWYRGIFFVGILLSNIIIGLIQDYNAKRLMNKMKLITVPKAKLVRGGKEIDVHPQEIVLDDVMVLKAGDQITSDGMLISGEMFVNEALLTGETANILKKFGDPILSGTYVVSGFCYAKVEKVGSDNYVEGLSNKAKQVKRNPSHILKSLKKLFRFLAGIIIAFFLIEVVTFSIQGVFNSEQGFLRIIGPMSGQLVAMVPAGLYLLTSMALASGVISLFKKGGNVQDLYSIEMLARANVLCVDKTGTITDGTMVVEKVVALNETTTEAEVSQIMSSILDATKDENVTAIALNKYFKDSNKLEASISLPFNSDNKYSGASFAGGNTYIFGAFEYMNIVDKEEIKKASIKYTSKGYRVLLLASGNELIKNNRYDDVLKPLAFIILKDHIKDDAMKTFKWFGENDVEIKVISGDNAMTVSEIAKQAGILNAEKYVSLENMSIEEVKKIALDYNVFGRVTPEQKEAIVDVLKANGKTVAMTGDGVNDILALKRADCSIAMNSGSQAAKNVSHIVLLNNDFSTMPEIVAEGRRVINNLERTGSLFLSKTFFAIFMAALFWIVSLATSHKYAYPFSTNNMMVWEVLGIGVSAFFIALERNSASIEEGFLRNILHRAIPGAAAIIGGALLCFLCYVLQETGVMYTGVNTFGYLTETSKALRSGATAMAVLTFSGLSLVVLYMICRPVSKYRLIVILSAIAVAFTAVILASYDHSPKNIFQLDFATLSAENYITVAVIIIVIGAVLLVAQTIDLNLKEKKDDKN